MKKQDKKKQTRAVFLTVVFSIYWTKLSYWTHFGRRFKLSYKANSPQKLSY